MHRIFVNFDECSTEQDDEADTPSLPGSYSVHLSFPGKFSVLLCAKIHTKTMLKFFMSESLVKKTLFRIDLPLI